MESQIADIKARLDIVNLVQSYVPSLKPAGRNYFGLCPFHSERSPSFSVNPELGIFKCFGCGEGGDVITFIQKIEGLEFPQALEIAANKAGIELEKFESEQTKKSRQARDRALLAHKLAAEYYHYLLTKHPGGKLGLEYALTKRKLTLELVVKYKLGFAPNGYHNLENFLHKKGFSSTELIEFGLLVNKNGRIFDKFRGRLLHPISNMQGAVVGFSGRIIDSNSKAPKYLNSPETIIYHKSEIVYGGYEAKDAMREHKFAIIVEGNIDVLSSVRAGWGNIICPLGTALTPGQLKLLKRYVSEVYFCYDTDSAGKKALLRSLELVENAGMSAKAISIGNDYKDVDELICANISLWGERVEAAMEVPDFILQSYKDDFDLSQASEKISYINTCMPFLAKLQDKIKIDHYLQRLENYTGTRYEVLLDKLNAIKADKSLVAKDIKPDIKATEINQTIEQPQRIKISTKLKNVLLEIYHHKSGVTDREKLAVIYRGNVTELEQSLLDYVLGFGTKISLPAKEILTEIIVAEKNILLEVSESTQQSVEAMLRQFVRQRLQSFLRQMQRMCKIENPEDVAANDYLHRINEYTRKIAQLGR